MLRSILTITCLVILALITACTSAVKPEEIDRIRIGEMVTVREYDGSVHRIRVTEIAEDSITGDYNGNMWSVTIPNERILEIEVIDYVKSAAGALSLPVILLSSILVPLSLSE